MEIKLVNTGIADITISQWISIMDACGCTAFEDQDLKDFVNAASILWKEIIDLKEIEPKTFVSFLEQEAPVYDNWQMIDDKYCCEKTMLKERERLLFLAKNSGI